MVIENWEAGLRKLDEENGIDAAKAAVKRWNPEIYKQIMRKATIDEIIDIVRADMQAKEKTLPETKTPVVTNFLDIDVLQDMYSLRASQPYHRILKKITTKTSHIVKNMWEIGKALKEDLFDYFPTGLTGIERKRIYQAIKEDLGVKELFLKQCYVLFRSDPEGKLVKKVSGIGKVRILLPFYKTRKGQQMILENVDTISKMTVEEIVEWANRNKLISTDRLVTHGTIVLNQIRKVCRLIRQSVNILEKHDPEDINYYMDFNLRYMLIDYSRILYEKVQDITNLNNLDIKEAENDKE